MTFHQITTGISSTILLVLLPSLASGQDTTFDIVVKDKALVQRCVTDKSSRNISVGIPGGFNFSFDPVRCRLVYVWFGDFLDYKSEASGRGGRKTKILGIKRKVGTGDIPLRISTPNKKPNSIRFRGYRKDPTTHIPTFVFEIDGAQVEQRIVSFGHDQVTIELRFDNAHSSPRYYHMDPEAVESVELSENLTWAEKDKEKGIIKIPATENWAQIRLQLKPSKAMFKRPEPTTNGALLYGLHCMSCHTLDGNKRIGPSFADLWTKKRTVLRNGKSVDVIVDENYIRESLINPQAAIVQGYENANKMIDIRSTLNEKQIDALVKYLLDLKTKPNKQK